MWRGTLLVFNMAIFLLILVCAPADGRSSVTKGPLPLAMKHYPAPDGHRCGVCPTYDKRQCGCSEDGTKIFHNHCVMDLYNCVEGTEYKNCWFANCVFD